LAIIKKGKWEKKGKAREALGAPGKEKKIRTGERQTLGVPDRSLGSYGIHSFSPWNVDFEHFKT
jgi:hypothetical protein